MDEWRSVGHPDPMGDKPGHYWDLREARWVKFTAPVVELPEQAEPVEDELLPAEEQLPG